MSLQRFVKTSPDANPFACFLNVELTLPPILEMRRQFV